MKENQLENPNLPEDVREKLLQLEALGSIIEENDEGTRTVATNTEDGPVLRINRSPEQAGFITIRLDDDGRYISNQEFDIKDLELNPIKTEEDEEGYEIVLKA